MLIGGVLKGVMVNGLWVVVVCVKFNGLVLEWWSIEW